MQISTFGSVLLLLDLGHGKPAKSHFEDLYHSVRSILSQHQGLLRMGDKINNVVCCKTEREQWQGTTHLCHFLSKSWCIPFHLPAYRQRTRGNTAKASFTFKVGIKNL